MTKTNPAARGQIDSAKQALKFMMAGLATVTLQSAKTGARYTFKIAAPRNEQGVVDRDARIRFVSVLTGPDNQASYTYLGFIKEGVAGAVYFHGRKSKVDANAPSALAFDWAFRALVKDVKPGTVTIWHEGRCGRCGRPLTVPESIASGFGPECAGRLGFASDAA